MSSRNRERAAALGVGDGLGAFFGGIGFVIATPGVWPYALVPVTVLLVLACGGCAGGAVGAWEAVFHFIDREAGGWKQAEGWVLTVLLAVVFILLALLAALALAQPLSGFALDAISHAQEKAMTGRASPKPPVLASAWNALKIGLVSFLLGVPVLAGLTVIGLLFPPAAVVTIPLKILVCGWMLAWDFVDYPLTMRDLGLRARLRWVVRNFPAFTVFGVLWALLVVVPGLVLLLLPMGVAGATQMVVMADGPGNDRFAKR
ncbi:MAG TPA: EI24 domain-containing protein [Gemmataceae bacterium]|nr:EI24 domain-containing protein [Gemmataceae bacterium]